MSLLMKMASVVVRTFLYIKSSPCWLYSLREIVLECNHWIVATFGGRMALLILTVATFLVLTDGKII